MGSNGFLHADSATKAQWLAVHMVVHYRRCVCFSLLLLDRMYESEDGVQLACATDMDFIAESGSRITTCQCRDSSHSQDASDQSSMELSDLESSQF